jgi:hypothetical protein
MNMYESPKNEEMEHGKCTTIDGRDGGKMTVAHSSQSSSHVTPCTSTWSVSIDTLFFPGI